jgi:uncharacterized protein YjbI with pentapeptide repeats
LPPWLVKIRKWVRKSLWWVTGSLLILAVFTRWPGIAAWLKTQFPGKTTWDYIEKLLIPIASPTAIGLSVWYLDRNAKDRETQREENNNNSQALQIYFERMSVLLLERQVVNLAEAAKKLAPAYKDPLVESARHAIRAQTLAILRIFSADSEKKSAAVRFLIESEILASLAVPLSGADLREADLKEAMLFKVNLSAAKLCKADLRSADLRGADLIGADLSSAWLNGANLYLARAWGSLLIGADLSHASAIEAKLMNAKCRNAVLFDADFTDADLRAADLSGADLSGADLSGAKLNSTQFVKGILRGTILRRAILSRANLASADLRDADLWEADLDKVTWNRRTKWPDGSRLVGARNIPQKLKEQLCL